MRWTTCLLLTLLALLPGAHAWGGDWPRFRGPDGTGVSQETGLPVQWSRTENVRWRTELPAAGNSSPVVTRDRVLITCATEQGRKRGLYCYDRGDGSLLWSQLVAFDGEEPTHATNPPCASSPATNGEVVVVWHGSAGVHCYDLTGKVLWSRDLGSFRHIWGHASSPVIYKDRVLLNCGPGSRSFVTALALADGRTLWQADEPGDDGEPAPGSDRGKWIGSWSTPQVMALDGREQVIVSLPHEVKAYDLESGETLWTCEGLGDLVYTSPVLGSGVCVAMSGYHGPALALRLGGSGNVTATHRLWHATQQNPQRIGSGVILGEYLYLANANGVMQCTHVHSGELRWQARLSESIWGSLVAAEDRLYVTDQAGTTYVMAASPERLEILAENRLEEPSNSTPAFSDGEIFLRTFQALYCIRRPEPQERTP